MLLNIIGPMLVNSKELKVRITILYNTRNLFMSSLEYPHLSLGFNRILRLRAGYKYNTTIAIRSGRVSDDYPKFCPCCGKGEQSTIIYPLNI